MNTLLLHVPARARVNAHALSAITASLILTACGGGGGGGGDAPAVSSNQPVQSTPPVTVQDDTLLPAVATVAPASYTVEADFRKGVFDAINAVRSAAGLGLLAQESRLDTAAQYHSDQRHNGHNNPFVAADANPGVRAQNVGYPYVRLMEDMSFEFWKDAQGVVDAEMNSVYHRIPLLDYRMVHVGIGQARWMQSEQDERMSTTIDVAYTSTEKQAAPNTPFVYWPRNGVTVAQVHMVAEDPDPQNRQNGQFSRPYGYPASIQLDPDKTISVTSFVMTDANGNVVPTITQTYGNDTALANHKNVAALVPLDWLPESSTFTVTFTGTSTYKGVSTPISQTWTYSTPSAGFTSQQCGRELVSQLYDTNPIAASERQRGVVAWADSFAANCIQPRASLKHNWYPSACKAAILAKDLPSMISSCTHFRQEPWKESRVLTSI